jgi:ParB/RepB/Spo0J family partition protein
MHLITSTTLYEHSANGNIAIIYCFWGLFAILLSEVLKKNQHEVYMPALPSELQVIRVKASSRMGGKPDRTANSLCGTLGFRSYSGQASLLCDGAIPPEDSKLFIKITAVTNFSTGSYELYFQRSVVANGQQPVFLARGRYFRVTEQDGHYSINVNCFPEGEWKQLGSMVLLCPNPNHVKKDPHSQWVPTTARRKAAQEKQVAPAKTPEVAPAPLSVVAGYKFVRVAEVDVALVHPFPGQPRKFFRDAKLREIADSIRNIGLQQLIQVRVLSESEPEYAKGYRYMLVDGEQRLRAHQIIKKPKIGVLVVEVGDRSEQYLRSLVLNLHREPHSHYELALAVIELVETRKGDAMSVARDLGRTPPWVYGYLGLRSLNKTLFELLNPAVGEARQLRIQHATLLAKMRPEVQVRVYEEALLKRPQGISKMTAFIKA